VNFRVRATNPDFRKLHYELDILGNSLGQLRQVNCAMPMMGFDT
jgi:hypothetical protein